MKTSVSFRLSDQALKNLEYIQQKSGINQTAAVEIALASFAISLGAPVENAPDPISSLAGQAKGDMPAAKNENRT